jgi:hypothetical protein
MDNETAGIIIRALSESDTPAVRDVGKDIVTKLLKRRRLVEAASPWQYPDSNAVYYLDHRGNKVWLDWKDDCNHE